MAGFPPGRPRKSGIVAFKTAFETRSVAGPWIEFDGAHKCCGMVAAGPQYLRHEGNRSRQPVCEFSHFVALRIGAGEDSRF